MSKFKIRKVFGSFYAREGNVHDTIHVLSCELHNNPNASYFSHTVGDNDGAGYIGDADMQEFNDWLRTCGGEDGETVIIEHGW